MQEEIEKMVIRLEEQTKTRHSQKGGKEKNWKYFFRKNKYMYVIRKIHNLYYLYSVYITYTIYQIFDFNSMVYSP